MEYYLNHWVRYIDIKTDQALPPEYGRCDNEIKCGIALFGETIFSLVLPDKKQKVLEILKKYDDGIIITSKIDNSGARLE